MRLTFTIFASAAILVPAAATAQVAQPAASPQAAEPATPPQATTPGQEQTAPGEASDLTPADTGTAPSGQTTAKGVVNANANAKAEVATTKVTKADVKAGATLYDSSGASVGKIDSVTAKGAVLDTGKVKVTVPLSSLAKSDKGLVIGMTKAQIEAAAKKS